MKSSRLFYFTVASVFIAGAAKVFSQSTVSVSKNVLVESSKFNGSPVVVTEFRGNSLDSLKKFSVLEFAGGRILREKQFGDDSSEKTSVERKFLDDGRISEISGLGLSISQAIAILHGGKIEAQNATDERGDACVCFAVEIYGF